MNLWTPSPAASKNAASGRLVPSCFSDGKAVPQLSGKMRRSILVPSVIASGADMTVS